MKWSWANGIQDETQNRGKGDPQEIVQEIKI